MALDDPPPLSTHALAQAAGVNPETLRYYERRGLLEDPPRSPAGYRRYPPEALRRVRFIKQAQALGFTLKEVRSLLDLRVRPGVGCAQIRDRAHEKITDIRERIRALEAMAEALDLLAQRCGGQGPAEACPILDALDEGRAAPFFGSS